MLQPGELDDCKTNILGMKTAVISLVVSFVALSAMAQEPYERYAVWSAENPSMKTSLFFNQEKYSPGDTAYFKVYLLENNKLLKGSNVMALSVINDRRQQCARVNFRINGGQTHNRIFLPDSLHPGYYKFVALSEWMIDNPSSPFFATEIPIVSRESLKRKMDSESTIRFFPEGGHLVSGVTNKVVVQSSDETESGTAAIVDAAGRQVATANLKAGLG